MLQTVFHIEILVLIFQIRPLNKLSKHSSHTTKALPQTLNKENPSEPISQLTGRILQLRSIFIADLEEDVDVNITDEDKFIPVRPEDEVAPEEEEENFVKIPTADPDELHGANFAEDAWNDIEKQILEPYEDLIAPADAEAFYDYGLTNLKLYFDRFEEELAAVPAEEPTSPDYPGPESTNVDEPFGL